MSALDDLVYKYQSLPPVAQVGIPLAGVGVIGFIALHGNNPFSSAPANPTATVTGPGVGDSNSGVAGTGDGGTGNSGTGVTPPISGGNPPTIPVCPAGQVYIPGIGCMNMGIHPGTPPETTPLPVAPVLTPGQRFPFQRLPAVILTPLKPLPKTPIIPPRPVYPTIRQAVTNPLASGTGAAPNNYLTSPQTAQASRATALDSGAISVAVQHASPVIKAGAASATVKLAPTTVTRALSRPVPV